MKQPNLVQPLMADALVDMARAAATRMDYRLGKLISDALNEPDNLQAKEDVAAIYDDADEDTRQWMAEAVVSVKEQRQPDDGNSKLALARKCARDEYQRLKDAAPDRVVIHTTRVDDIFACAAFLEPDPGNRAIDSRIGVGVQSGTLKEWVDIPRFPSWDLAGTYWKFAKLFRDMREKIEA